MLCLPVRRDHALNMPGTNAAMSTWPCTAILMAGSEIWLSGAGPELVARCMLAGAFCFCFHVLGAATPCDSEGVLACQKLSGAAVRLVTASCNYKLWPVNTGSTICARRAAVSSSQQNCMAEPVTATYTLATCIDTQAQQ